MLSSKKLGDVYEGALKNNYLYNGKELFEDADLNWYDYGFRNYDPQIGRFTQLDPLTDNYPYLTPYQYASCDPITNIDVDGLEGFNSVQTLEGVVVTAARHTTSVAAKAGNTVRVLSTMSKIGIAIKAANLLNNAFNSQPVGNNAEVVNPIKQTPKSIIDNTTVNHNYVDKNLKSSEGLGGGGKNLTGGDGGLSAGRKGSLDYGDGDPISISFLAAFSGMGKLRHNKFIEVGLTLTEDAHELHKEGLLGEEKSELPVSPMDKKPDYFDVRKVYENFTWDSAKGALGGFHDSGIDTNKYYYILPNNSVHEPDTMVIVSVPKNEKKKHPTKKGNKKP